MTMRKTYIAPVFEIVRFNPSDIIATSGSLGVFDGTTDIYQSRDGGWEEVGGDWAIGQGDF